MPRLPVQPFRKNASNIEILNAVRRLAGTDYQRRIPEATKANVRETIDRLWDGRNFGARNEFLDALVNQIGLIIFRNNSYTNPLAEFKRGMLTNGDSIEEVQVGLVPSYVYDPDRDMLERAVFGQEKPNVQASIHKINRQEFYKITINEDILRRAFLADQGLASFVSQLMEAPSTSDNLDEFNLMCELLNEYNRAEGFFNVQVPDVGVNTSTEAQAKSLLRETRAMTETLKFHTPYYNAAGMHTHADPDKLVLFTTPRVKAALDVNALAAAFNVEYADALQRVKTIPEENMPGNGTQAILTTEDFFVVADTLMEVRSIQNPAGLYNNYFLHHHEILSVSRFVPAVRFSTEASDTITIVDPTVTSVPDPEVSVLSAFGTEAVEVTEVERGNVYQVLVTAVTDDDYDFGGDVRLELAGNESSFTKLSNTGTLIVGLDEPATELTVTATALADETKSATATVSVTGDMVTMWPDPRVEDAPAPEPDPEPTP